MNKNKISDLKEKQIKKASKKYFEEASKYAQNPIEAKFVAFKKAKKNINIEDLF